MRSATTLLAGMALLLSGCNLVDDPPAATTVAEVAAKERAARCAGRIMTIYYEDALAYDNTAGPQAVRMRKTVELLDERCAADPAACVPKVVAAGISQGPPRGRAMAVAAYEQTTACTG